MGTDPIDLGSSDAALTDETDLVAGLVTAISGSAGPLDQDAIDAALGVTPLPSEAPNDPSLPPV